MIFSYTPMRSLRLVVSASSNSIFPLHRHGCVQLHSETLCWTPCRGIPSLLVDGITANASAMQIRSSHSVLCVVEHFSWGRKDELPCDYPLSGFHLFLKTLLQHLHKVHHDKIVRRVFHESIDRFISFAQAISTVTKSSQLCKTEIQQLYHVRKYKVYQLDKPRVYLPFSNVPTVPTFRQSIFSS